MLVSVIIPCWNTEKYLGECLDSVCSQTLRDIEIICVNDGSTDSSLEIMKAYQEVDPRIVIVEQYNSGVAVARNTGLSKASGEYVYFLDSDDMLFSENTLEKAVSLMQSNSLDLLVGGGQTFYDQPELESALPKHSGLFAMNHHYEDVMTGVQLAEGLIANKEWNSQISTKLYKLSYLKQKSFVFIPGQLHEDVIFHLKTVLSAERAMAVSEVFFKRRLRPASIMTSGISAQNIRGYLINYIEI